MPSAHIKPILIIGAGPVGLLLAHLLARQGQSCVLVDKRRTQPDWSRAIGITPASLSILRSAGLLPLFLEKGVAVRRARVYDEDREVGVLGFSGLPSGFPFILSIPQADTMAILNEELIPWRNVTFCPGLELRGLDQDDQGVRALLASPGARHGVTLEADWLVGCDGSDSATRALAGIPAERDGYGLSFVMGDFEDATGWGEEARLFFTPDGSLESFPLPGGRRRWVALQPAAFGSHPAPGALARAAQRVCGERLGRPCSPETAFVPERLLAGTFRKGRILLAGDAAHVMCPIGGQGMNTGFGDADHLAAVLPMLENPANRERLLGDYDRARREAFTATCARAAAGMWLGTRTGRRASAFRSFFFHWALGSPAVSSRLARHFAMATEPQPAGT